MSNKYFTCSKRANKKLCDQQYWKLQKSIFKLEKNNIVKNDTLAFTNNIRDYFNGIVEVPDTQNIIRFRM